MTIRIPDENRRFSQPNNSDASGNVWYVKNMNFDKEGYVSLSPRVCSAFSEATDGDMELPMSFGRYGNGSFRINAADGVFFGTIAESGISVSEDATTDVPSLSTASGSTYWQNRWYITGTATLNYYSGSSWTADVGSLALTNGVIHAIEVFKNRNTLVITNGNVLKQIDTSHSTTDQTQLTIPADYEMVDVAYSNNKVGIITRVASTVSSQNTESYFFVWDGVSDEAEGFPTGSDTTWAVVPYGQSWAIITRTGQMLWFNGSGFNPLSTSEIVGASNSFLPIYYDSVNWGDTANRSVYGDAMLADGDIIYANLSVDLNPIGEKFMRYRVNMPSGIHCYDPKVGIYHRHGYSLSPAYQLDVANTDVDTTNNTFTTSGTIPATGNPIRLLNTGGAPGGIVTAKTYFVIKDSSTVFKLATTKANALAGTAIDITSQGTGTHEFMAINVLDYAATYLVGGRSGGVALFGNRDAAHENLIFGGRFVEADGTSTQEGQLCFTVPGVENIGYLVTPKAFSRNTTDTFVPITVKHKPLNTEDKIIVKYRTREIYGLPEMTTKNSGTNNCTWTDANTFTTTEDLSVSLAQYTAGKDLECEIISGAGAGFQAQVSSITYSTGTYTVNLAEDVPGAGSGYYSNAVIDHWTKGFEITYSNQEPEGYKDIPVEGKGKFVQAKIECRGVDVTIEEIVINNKVFKPNG